MEETMSFGNILYLGMVTGLTVVFSLVLGYQSWQLSRRGPEMLGGTERAAGDGDHRGTVHA
jgi:hypothetical protein